MEFKYTIEEYQETRSVGLTVKTDMQLAEKDCLAIWQSFGPRIATEIIPHAVVPSNVHSFGICRMIDEERFYYSATLEITSMQTLPKDMHEILIPKGLYVKCDVPSLAHIKEAYEAIYTEWPKSQTGYEFDMQGLWFERYPPGAEMDTPFEIYAAVKKCSQ